MSEMLVTTLAKNQTVIFDGITHTLYSYGFPIGRRMGLDSYIDVIDSALVPGGNGTHGRQGKPPLDFSQTTRKYLWKFLGMSKDEAYAAVKSGRINIVKELK